MKRRFRQIALMMVLLVSTAMTAYCADAWWMVLEQGKRAFREGDYAQALTLFEDAGRQREAHFARLYENLKEGLSLDAVRALGGSLQKAERYFSEKRLERYLIPLRELAYHIPRETLGDSSDEALVRLDGLRHYPEASYWLGEVFMAEGELGLATTQLKKAWDLRAFLETPDFAREILYRLADVYERQGDTKGFVESLLSVLSQDELFSSSSMSFMGKAILSGLPQQGADEFLKLYRNNKPEYYQAHRRLGLYYSRSGRHDEAMRHLTFAFLIESSVLIDFLRHSDHQWQYSSFADLLNRSRRIGDLAAYMDESQYYETLYHLGTSLFFKNNPDRKVARELWTVVAGRYEAGEWQRKARRQLQNPQPETILPSRS